MFGKKKLLKEIEELRLDVRKQNQRIRFLESDTKRQSAVLDFLYYKKKTPIGISMNDSLDDDIIGPIVNSTLGPSLGANKSDEVLIPQDCVQKIDKLSKINYATKDDIIPILEIFTTISSLFSRMGKSEGEDPLIKL